MMHVALFIYEIVEPHLRTVCSSQEWRLLPQTTFFSPSYLLLRDFQHMWKYEQCLGMTHIRGLALCLRMTCVGFATAE